MAGIASSSSSSSEDLTSTPVVQQPEPVDVLLQRRKCELMYELKNLQHGERPVTGSDSRGKVDNFFTKRIQIQESSTPVANTDEVEEHRPQQVTIEVQGLLQRRSVSSVLQSDHFRRSLENAVRTHFTPAASTNSTSSRRTRAAVNVARSSTAPPAPPMTSSLIPPPAVNTLSVQNADHDNSFVSASPSESHLAPPQQHHQQQQQQETRPVAIDEEEMRRWSQEEFVMEISELVHRQLVSSTLHSPFRNRLERHVRTRVGEIGSNGQAVQEHILSLPPSNIRHNDFSHLGISSAQDQQQLDDAVSLISATASASIPFAQSNGAVRREISAMKSQISQLSNMLKMSLDLQMDIQRSIRQEVAAAISQSNASAASQSTVPTAGTQYNSRRADDSKCIICLDGEADAVFYRCGHLCTCYACALRMKGESGICPVCRAPISDILRAYRISHDS